MRLCGCYDRLMYSNPSVYEQSVYEFLLIRDAQINIYLFFSSRANFRIYDELLPLANRSLFPSGSNGKLIFVLRVFALRAVLEERIKLVNRGITVFNLCASAESSSYLPQNNSRIITFASESSYAALADECALRLGFSQNKLYYRNNEFATRTDVTSHILP
jgi:hypothetical protein